MTRSQERVFILCGIADGADLPGAEALGDQLVAGHQPDSGRQAGRAGRELDQRGDDVVVERARIDLTDAGQHPVEAQVRGDLLLQDREPRRVAMPRLVLPPLPGGGAQGQLADSSTGNLGFRVAADA